MAAMVAVILLWGSGPVVTKLITANPMLGATLRFAFSIPVLYAIVKFRGGSVSRTVMRQAALPGIAFGINLIFVFAAVQEVTVAVLAVAVALQPALLLIVAGPLLNERATPAQAAWTVVGVIATAGVILGAGSELRATALGVILALLALFSFTIYFALTRVARANTAVDPFEWMTAINIWSLIATIPPLLFSVRSHHLRELDGMDIFWLLVLAYLTGVAGHVLMSWVHGFIEASRSSLYLLGMNITAVALAWPVHGERVTVVQALCGLVVLFAVGSVIRIGSRAT